MNHKWHNQRVIDGEDLILFPRVSSLSTWEWQENPKLIFYWRSFAWAGERYWVVAAPCVVPCRKHQANRPPSVSLRAFHLVAN